MSQYTEGNVKAFTAGEDLAAFRRVKFSAGTVIYADAGEVSIGTTELKKDSGEQVSIRLNTASGTRKVTAAGTFSIGAELYGAADGKVDDTVIGQIYGTALEAAATGDGDIIEVIPHIGVQHINYDRIFGELLSGGTEQGLTVVSDTQNYAIGTRLETADGEEAIYSLSSGECWSGRGAKFIHDMTDGIDFQLLNATAAVGAESIEFAAGTHPAFAEDELIGGLLLISDQDSGETQDKMVQQRVITGNDVSLENAACTVYFNGGLTRQVTNATYAFCMPNPYSSIAHDERSGLSVAGIPASYVSGSGKYFWLKKRCKVWLAPQDAVGKTAHAREIVFRHDGSLDIHDDSKPTAEFQQHAGYIVDNNAAANGATFVQIKL